MSIIYHNQIFTLLEQWAPKNLAYDWDNVGVQIGSKTDVTKKVMVTLDVLESVVDEAIEKDVNLIIAHHPLLFKPINHIDFQTPKGKVIKKLIEHEITVYAAHTNLDIADGGVNDLLCDALQIGSTKNFIHVQNESLYKLAVFVPESHENELRNALSNKGAGHIGNYSHCTFRTEGQGTFRPLEGTNPYIGTTNKLEFVNEVKLETIVQETKLANVLQAMKKVHPYEEVAYDIYPLKQKGKSYGLGRIGKLSKAVTLYEFAEKVKNTFQLRTLKVVGELDNYVEKIAVLGGSGEKFIQQAKKMGADVYITGDLTFHHAQDAMEMGLSLIDPGHYVEQIMKKATKQYIEKHFQEITTIESTINTNPFQFV